MKFVNLGLYVLSSQKILGIAQAEVGHDDDKNPEDNTMSSDMANMDHNNMSAKDHSAMSGDMAGMDHGEPASLKGKTPVATAGPKKIVMVQDNDDIFINYYIKRKDYTMDNGKKRSAWEFHGNCFANEINVQTWEAGSVFACDLGFYYATKDPNKVDWMHLTLKWKGINAEVNDDWACVDSFSKDSTVFPDEFTVDDKAFCHANG